MKDIAEIPLFPHFEILNLQHKELFENYLKNYPAEISELNFTEVFMWRNLYKAKISNLNKNIIILIEKNDDTFFYPPIGCESFVETVRQLLLYNHLDGRKSKIFGFTKKELEELSSIRDNLVITEMRNFADYIYRTDDLIKLRGRKYDGKRNYVKKFKDSYDFQFIEITEKLLPECIEFQDRWCRLHNCIKRISLADENTAVNEVFGNWKNLSVFGAVIKINGQVEAITVAGELNKKTAVVHIEKANPNFRGIYQAVNQMFCEKKLFKYEFVNREQDLGIAGLRKAKMSYNPICVLEKFMVFMK